MNNYYTLIYLIREWKEKIIGSHFDKATSTRKNLLELYFEQGDSHYRLLFSSSPQNSALFLDRYQSPKLQNAATFFEYLQGDILSEVHLADGDRYITFIFTSGKRLIFQLYSNHANVLLCDHNLIVEAFKKDKVLSGCPVPEASPVEKSKVSSITKINDLIALVDPLLPRSLVKQILSDVNVSSQQEYAIQRVNELRSSLLNMAHPHFSETYGFGIVHPSILGLSEYRSFDSVNEAIAFAFFRWVKFQDFESKKKSLSDRIEKSISRTHIAISELNQVSDSDQRADEFEKLGHLLMSVPYETTQSGVVTVQDYFKSGESVAIKVDPLKSIIENAQSYYEKSRSVKRSSETYSRRLSEFRQKVKSLEVLKEELGSIKFGRDLEKWLKSNEQALKKLGYSESESLQTAQHFRTFQSGDYEIRVGKSATSNDELLRISRKDDLWLHARGVAGSHVVIPLNKNQHLPPKNILEYAAGLAAFFSKAKGSSLVPVIFTRKKFVRKSKGMAPGAVIVEKEEVLLVPPIKPDDLNSDE